MNQEREKNNYFFAISLNNSQVIIRDKIGHHLVWSWSECLQAVESKTIDRTFDELVENTSYQDNHTPLLHCACCASLLIANRLTCDLVPSLGGK
jgi:hypothetical protein